MCARVCVRIVKTWPLAEIMFTVGFTPLAQATSMIQIAEIRPRVHPIYIPFSFFYYCLLFIPLRDPSLSLFLLAAYSPLLPPLPLLLSSFFLFFLFFFFVHPLLQYGRTHKYSSHDRYVHPSHPGARDSDARAAASRIAPKPHKQEPARIARSRGEGEGGEGVKAVKVEASVSCWAQSCVSPGGRRRWVQGARRQLRR